MEECKIPLVARCRDWETQCRQGMCKNHYVPLVQTVWLLCCVAAALLLTVTLTTLLYAKLTRLYPNKVSIVADGVDLDIMKPNT